MDLEYTTHEGLSDLISQINTKYYARFNANILYLEELADRIYVIYIVELRDAYSHLVRIFDDDILSGQGHKNALYHLSEYVTHLQRGLLDTFRKILALEFSELKKHIHRNSIKAVEVQIAEKAAGLRIMDKNHSVDQRIEGYISLMDHISATRKKLTL
jgi:hypothetical protein